MTGQREPDRGGPTTGLTEPDRAAPSGLAGPERGDATSDGRGADHGPTPMRGVWVAVAIVGGAAVVFLLLALTSGALNV